jgi:hypothetical protein
MAIHTLYIHMRTSQRESGQVVVKGSVCPIRRVVAGIASSSKCPIVLVILRMAGVAILGSAFKTARVAALARHINVFPHKREVRQAMVKFGRLPAFRAVAPTTLCAEFSRMGIIGYMAGFTRCEGVL